MSHHPADLKSLCPPPSSLLYSEPEVILIRDVALAFRPHAWVNIHSGMEALFLPYDHVARIPDGADALASLAVLQELNRTACGGRCAVGSGGKSVGCVGGHKVQGRALRLLWHCDYVRKLLGAL